MKKSVCLVLMIIMLVCMVASCGQAQKNRILFSDTDLSKSVELGDYKDIPVDTSSDTYKGYYDDVVSSDIENYNFYVKKTEGKVEEGDTANIDYVGKKDGVAFDGGTAEGYDLTIGSGSFIDGFEDGLIGVAIGDTVDLNLTFPEDYDNEELNGAAVVFTVKVNYVVTEDPMEPADYYAELDYESVEAYEAASKETAIKNYIMDTILANSEINEYPEKDLETVYSATKKIVEANVQSSYGIDFATYLSYMGTDEATFKEEQIKPMLDNYLVVYAIADEENFKVEQEDITQELNDAVKEINNSEITADYLKEYYGEYYFEAMAYSKKAVQFVYDNAKID